jgi:hypothetical protein
MELSNQAVSSYEMIALKQFENNYVDKALD